MSLLYNYAKGIPLNVAQQHSLSHNNLSTEALYHSSSATRTCNSTNSDYSDSAPKTPASTV